PIIDGQILIYPIVDTDIDRGSYLAEDNQLLLTRELMKWFIGHYLNDRHERNDPCVAPMRTIEKFDNLPRSLIITAQYDVLLDENIEYISRLRGNGLEVTHLHLEGEMHGIFPHVDTHASVQEVINAVYNFLHS